MQVITDPSKLDKELWNKYVFNHPNGNIFHTSYMYDVFCTVPKYEPIFISVLSSNGELIGLLLGIIQKESVGIFDKMTSRAIVNGGPLVHENNPDTLGKILIEYNEIIGKRAIYSQFRNLWDCTSLKEIFKTHGFYYEAHLNIIVNLSSGEQRLWAGINPKRKNEIRKSQIEGTKFRIGNSIDDLSDCYTILKSVYKRAKLPIPPYDYFKALFLKSGENNGIKIFCAVYEERIIGCMIALVFKDVIYDYYAGANIEFYNKHPNDLIPWEVFIWGINNGFSKFDFGGAGKPGVKYGVREYKRKFGGEFVDFGRFEKIHKPFLYSMGKFALNLWKILN